MPTGSLLYAQLVQVVPGIEARIVAVVEHQLQGVVADRFDVDDGDVEGLFLQKLQSNLVKLSVSELKN